MTAAEADGRAQPATPRVLDQQDLLGADRSVVILHDGRRYVLQVTRQNRLILTRDEADRLNSGADA